MKRIADDIKNKSFHKLYLLFGEEKYLRRVYLSRLLGALDAGEDSMNFTRFEGRRETAEIINACETMPFFAERRVVLIEDSGFFKEKCEELNAYIDKLPDYLVLIFSEQDVDKRGRLYKAAASEGVAAEFKTLDERGAARFVVSELKKNGKKIRQQPLELFLGGTGPDLGFISCELEKLVSYCIDREEITAEDIEAVCSPRVENRVFDMISDMASGRRDAAVKKYHDLILLKEPPMKMLVLMERQFRQLLSIKQLLASGMGERQIAEALGAHPYSVKKNIPLARIYSAGEIRGILEKMTAYDEDVKSGRLNDRIAVELLLLDTKKPADRTSVG